mmetsp:Transcript_15199/g.30268  ORF Transcript_15199/g.30268 Transcript_15199/m.30268 type:complete len:324 (+) Transcript_15199:27-998(+)
MSFQGGGPASADLSAIALLGFGLFVAYKAGDPEGTAHNSGIRACSAVILILLYHLRLRTNDSSRANNSSTRHGGAGKEILGGDEENWVLVSTPEAKNNVVKKPGCDEEGWTLEASIDQPYVHNDHEFAHCKFYHDTELGSDLMYVQSRAKVPMRDTTVGSILENVSQCLHRTHEKRTHFPSLYDIRQYELPGPSGAYARAKQLVKWCEGHDHLIDKHIHSVAVVIPSGFGAKLLKNCVQFIIWATQPPMDPRVFEDRGGQGLTEARDFLKRRVEMYKARELEICKPTTDGQSFFLPPTAEEIQKYGSSCHPPPKEKEKKKLVK